MLAGAVYAVAIGVTGGLAGAVAGLGWENRPGLVVGILIVLVVGVSATAGALSGRSTARQAGIPRKSLRPLLRRIRHVDIPDDPRERAETGRLVAVQREALERPNRHRRVFRAVAAVFVLSAVFQFLDGSPLWGLTMLALAALQLCQPLLSRKALGRPDRVTAGLRGREQETA
ncbi:hypothetical protein [Streptomyces sp. ITFR-6]|uniref:hypothetical protein n=1 Tax=Streptomyces sp. ITFR-6 TaxID=3075197 RepID=UPI0028898D27|nr:hypothetical protein [Streptomyces sp. ITFR-6]WNI30664.1 hypothetical protein RLT59_19110 [Streptomyces sp. ITFR-6]